MFHSVKTLADNSFTFFSHLSKKNNASLLVEIKFGITNVIFNEHSEVFCICQKWWTETLRGKKKKLYQHYIVSNLKKRNDKHTHVEI